MNLNGKRILLIGAKTSHNYLSARIISRGGKPFFFPSLEIHPIEQSELALDKGRVLCATTDWIIVLSQHAIQHLPVLWQQIIQARKNLKIIGIGPTTCEALREAGIHVFCGLPKGSTSETLISKSFFQQDQVQNKKILILSGKGGRTLILETLIERDANVSQLILYERVLAKLTLTIEQIYAWNLDAIYVNSAEGLNALLRLTPSGAHLILKSVRVLAMSDRIKAHALGMGFNFADVMTL